MFDRLFVGYVQWSRLWDDGSYGYFAAIIMAMQLYLNFFTLFLVYMMLSTEWPPFGKPVSFAVGAIIMAFTQFTYVVPTRLRRRIPKGVLYPRVIDRKAAYGSIMVFAMSMVACLASIALFYFIRAGDGS